MIYSAASIALLRSRSNQVTAFSKTMSVYVIKVPTVEYLISVKPTDQERINTNADLHIIMSKPKVNMID